MVPLPLQTPTLPGTAVPVTAQWTGELEAWPATPADSGTMRAARVLTRSSTNTMRSLERRYPGTVPYVGTRTARLSSTSTGWMEAPCSHFQTCLMTVLHQRSCTCGVHNILPHLPAPTNKTSAESVPCAFSTSTFNHHQGRNQKYSISLTAPNQTLLSPRKPGWTLRS